MRPVNGPILSYPKNYYETVLKKNKHDNFLFFKSGDNKLSIFSDLGADNKSPMLFTEIDNIKGDRLSDFEVIDYKNPKFKEGQTFNPTGYKQIANSES